MKVSFVFLYLLVFRLYTWYNMQKGSDKLMFVDLKYISEQEKIIVSDDKGNMNEISYQDNAGDIYILKNIIERLEANKICLNAKQDKLKSELKECLENIKKKKTSKLFLFIGIPLSYTIFPPYLCYSLTI